MKDGVIPVKNGVMPMKEGVPPMKDGVLPTKEGVTPVKDGGQAFVHIVTGEVDSGKTTRLLSIFRKLGAGDGFINAKIYSEGRFIGYRIIRLSTGESAIFSVNKEFIPRDWDEEYTYGNFSFSRKGLEFARNAVLDIIPRGTGPVFIDEIGPLELMGKGLHDIFSKLLSSGQDIYAVIRESCIDSVLKEFGISRFDIIRQPC